MWEHFQAVTIWEPPGMEGQEAGWYSSLRGFGKTQGYAWFVSIVKVSFFPKYFAVFPHPPFWSKVMKSEYTLINLQIHRL